MLQDNEDPVTTLKEGEALITQQNLETDIQILGQEPIFPDKEKITVNKNVDRTMDNSSIKGDYFQEIDKTTATAKRFKNRIFLGTDGNYYKSKKNKKGNYVWILVEKK